MKILLVNPQAGGVPGPEGCKPEGEAHPALLGVGRDGRGDHLDHVGPAAGVEDVEVGVAHRGPVGLVRQVGRPLGERRHPPVEGLGRAGVPPAAAVAVEAADSLEIHLFEGKFLGNFGEFHLYHVGCGWDRLALPVVEGDVVHGDVAAGPGVAPDALDDDLEAERCSRGLRFT